jgi:hypothetical protein
MLGLERLVVGRECNAFDRLSPARKSRAYAELIHHGLAYGKVEEVAGQDFPNVTVQRVSSRGRRLNRSASSSRGSRPSAWKPFWLYVALAAALLGCLYLVTRITSS